MGPIVGMENIILLFLIMIYHLNYFEIVNKITYKYIISFFEFDNIEFYFILLVVYGIKYFFLPMIVLWDFISFMK
jgi:hypothetical protein